MEWLRVFLSRLAAFFGKAKLDAELDEEFRAHVDFATEQNRRRGLSADQARTATTLVGIFSLLALVLAFVGIYGLMQYSVAQRTREIGIRMALGADRSGIVSMIVRECLTLAAMGLGAGMAINWFATRAVSKLLYGVKVFDPVTLSLVSVVLVGAAVVAGFRPARRAASVDPMHALRTE
jgi:ABC-type antimicrobial peptide transport system permease subunit